MAIMTLNGLIAGARAPEDIMKVSGAMKFQGYWHSLAYGAGFPGAAVAPTPGVAGAALTSYPGQVPFTNPTSGQSTYLARFAGTATIIGVLRLYDRLWHNSGLSVTTTTAQTVNSVAWPARDRAGSTNGEGVMVAIEASAATTNGALINGITMSYTNSAGTAGRTATASAFPNTATIGSWVPFALQAGDSGVRSIQSVTLGASLGSGAVHLVAYRSLMTLSVTSSNISSEFNSATGGMPQMYDNTVPFFVWLANSSVSVTVTAQLSALQG